MKSYGWKVGYVGWHHCDKYLGILRLKGEKFILAHEFKVFSSRSIVVIQLLNLNNREYHVRWAEKKTLQCFYHGRRKTETGKVQVPKSIYLQQWTMSFIIAPYPNFLGYPSAGPPASVQEFNTWTCVGIPYSNYIRKVRQWCHR